MVAILLVSRSPRALFPGIYEDPGKIAFGVIAIFAMLLVLSAGHVALWFLDRADARG